MAQFARPDSDVTTGGWTPNGGPVSLFDTLNEIVIDDADFSESANNPTADLMEVGLSSIDDPVGNTGHVLRYRYQKDAAAGRQIDLTVSLLEGADVIASFVHVNIGNPWVTQAQLLTSPQADAITDYTDLRIRFTANDVGGGAARAAQVSFAEFEIPLQLSGTIVSVSTLLGTLEAAVPLAGVIPGQSALSGSMIATVPLAGNVLSVSALAGSLNIPRVLQGLIAGQSALTGDLPVVRTLGGVVSAVSALQGRILLQHEIAGVIAAVSSLSGSLSVDFAMSGTIEATSDLEGFLRRSFRLRGISNTFSSAEGMLRVAFMVAGLIEAQAILDGRLRINGEQITTGVGGKVNPLVTVGGKVAVSNE